MTWLAGEKITSTRLNEESRPGQLAFFAFRSAAQSVANRAAELVGDAISWDDIQSDPFSGWGAGNPTRYTATVAGYYLSMGSIGYNAWTNTAGTLREAIWYRNGSLLAAGRSTAQANGSISAVALTADSQVMPILLAVGDYIELVPLQNSTSTAMTTATGSLRPYICLTYLGNP